MRNDSSWNNCPWFADSEHAVWRDWFVRCEWCPGASEVVAEMGGIDGGRFSVGRLAIERNVFVALRHFGKARPALAARNGFAERALRFAASSRAGIRRRLP